MAERKREKFPHPLLAPYVQAERGRMTALVAASGKTWAAVNNVIWHGTIPGHRFAKALADKAGVDVDAVIAGSEQANEARRSWRESRAAA